MGGIQSKQKTIPCETDVKGLAQKIRLLQGEINEIMCMRENESQAYERAMMVYTLKEAERKREQKRLREEVKKLRRRLEEKEGRLREMEAMDVMVVGEKFNDDKQWLPLLRTSSQLMEHVREERARRDEAVEKWKQLYLAIKIELDDLIQKTNQEERLYWRAEEEDLLDELHRELKAKEETVELLQARLASMEQEGSRREIEMGILRQSLRIMSYKNKAPQAAKGLS